MVPGALWSHLAEADACIQTGDLASAEEPLAAVEKGARNTGDPFQLTWALRLRSDILRLRGDLDGALALVTEARSLSEKAQTWDMAAVYLAEGRVRAARGEPDAARHALEAAVRRAREQAATLLEWFALQELAHLLHGTPAGDDALASARHLLRGQMEGLSDDDRATFLGAFGREAILVGGA